VVRWQIIEASTWRPEVRESKPESRLFEDIEQISWKVEINGHVGDAIKEGLKVLKL
jgi:hypothetical protein